MRVRSLAAAGILLAVLALGLACCSSLPLPDTPEQSLLFIPCEISFEDTRDNQARTASLDLVLRRVNDGREFAVPIARAKKYAVVALDPGGYEFARILVRRERTIEGKSTSTWTEKRETSRISFFMAEKIVRWYEGKFTFRDLSGGKYTFFLMGRSNAPLSERQEVLAAMKKDSHWLGWEGYELINFTVQ